MAGEKTKHEQRQTTTLDEIGQLFVPRALNHTKKPPRSARQVSQIVGSNNLVKQKQETGSLGTEPGTGNRTVLEPEPAELGVKTEPVRQKII